MEKLVYRQLYSFFTLHNCFYTSQHDFKKLHSTEIAALEFIDIIFKVLDSCEYKYISRLVKTFATLDHSILFHINYYGANGSPLNWFKRYPTDRPQYVQLDYMRSKALPIHTRVPRGQFWAHFSSSYIYVNDMHMASTRSILYADDTTLVKSLCSFNINNMSNEENIYININNE